MPRLIDPSAQERPIPRPARGATRLPVISPGAELGQGIQSLGRDVSGAAEEIFRAQKIEEDRINTLRAEEASTNLRSRALDLRYGEGGFSSLKGAQAVTRPIFTEWGKRFQDVETEIAAGLSNDEQRTRFRQRADATRLGFQEDILRHMAREGDVYAKEVYDARTGTALRRAAASWDQPNAVASELVIVRDAVAERADRHGWTNEYRAAVYQEEASKVHATVIGQALAVGQFRYAQKWYEANREDIDPQTSARLAKAVEDGTQKELMARYSSTYLANEDSPAQLESLRKQVLGDEGLGEDRRNILVGRIQNRQSVLERRSEVEEMRRTRLIQGGINELNASTLAGYEPTAEQFSPYVAAAKGTELEPQVTQAIRLADATRTFRTQPPAEQERLLAEAEAGVRTDPTKFDRRVVAAWRTIFDSQRAQARESPVTFAVRQGIIPPPTPLDLSQPGESRDAFAERFAISRAMSERYQAPFKPLTPEEVTLMRSTLSGASAEQKRGYFTQLARAAGDDAEGYSAIMAQLAPDDPVAAVAGTYSYRGRIAAADLMLRGQAILTPKRTTDGKPDQGKLWPMPPDTELRKGFQSYERDAFAGHPEARSAMYQSAVAIYAAKASEEGDASGVINNSRWEDSIRLATGGVQVYNSKAIVMPYGMDWSEFKDEIGKRLQWIVDSGKLAPEVARRLHDLPLETVGDGRYVLRAGDGILVNKDNQPVVLNFNAWTPIPRSRIPGSAPTSQELAEAERPVTGRAAAPSAASRRLPPPGPTAAR